MMDSPSTRKRNEGNEAMKRVRLSEDASHNEAVIQQRILAAMSLYSEAFNLASTVEERASASKNYSVASFAMSKQVRKQIDVEYYVCEGPYNFPPAEGHSLATSMPCHQVRRTHERRVEEEGF